jgi:hypothetical protein
VNKEIINYQGSLYWVYRKVKQTQINQEFISELKAYWLCDLVVRDKNSENPKLLFLREISDAMILKN